MKTIYKTIFILAGILLFASCQKDEIKVVNKEFEINEKSSDYQRYIAERAFSYLKFYRFEKAAALLEKVTDEAIKREFEQAMKKYKAKAEKDGFYFITPENETLFFRYKPHEDDPPSNEMRNLKLNFQRGKGEHIINSEGAFYGFKNYPLVEKLLLTDCFATQFPDIYTLKHLNHFIWESNEEYYEEINKELKPAKLDIDFSKFPNLKKIELENVDLDAIPAFPDKKTERVTLSGSQNNLTAAGLKKINTQRIIFDKLKMENGDVVSHVQADTIEIGEVEIANDRLTYNGKTAKKLNCGSKSRWGYIENEISISELDFSESRLEDLELYAKKILKIKLNPQLKSFKVLFYNYDLKNPPQTEIIGLTSCNHLDTLSIGLSFFKDLTIDNLPTSVKKLNIGGQNEEWKNGTLDFTRFNKLEYLSLGYYVKGNTIKLPSSLKIFSGHLYKTENPEEVAELDFSDNTLLEKIDFSFFRDVKSLTTPQSLVSIILGATNKLETLDLSQSDKLDYLSVDVSYGENVKIIFPPNLKESQFKKKPSIRAKKNVILVNKPDWLEIKYTN